MNVLIVEDLRDTVDSMRFLLELWGCKSTVVYNGQRAIEAAATLNPDIVILDIGLPDMSGWDVSHRLRQSPTTASALMVAVTGYGQPDDIKRSKEVGIDLHFLKPADPEDIKRVLISWEQSLTKRHGRPTDLGTTATSA
jgi:CheY-like chemotaxis protein